MAANITDIQRFLDLAGVIILVLDSDQQVRYINKQGCDTLEVEREDILGKNWFDNFLPCLFQSRYFYIYLHMSFKRSLVVGGYSPS